MAACIAASGNRRAYLCAIYFLSACTSMDVNMLKSGFEHDDLGLLSFKEKLLWKATAVL